MPQTLICTCSARLEIDDKFIGQTINCPDCNAPHVVPAPQETPVRTSGWALASLLLALIGAYTLIGTVLAIFSGVLALFLLKRQSGAVAGRGFALAGIILGAFFTVLSLFAYNSVELFGMDAQLRTVLWRTKLDYPAELEVQRHNSGFAITRPSAKWGVSKSSPGLLLNEDLMLVQPAESAYILCLERDVKDERTIHDCYKSGLEELRSFDPEKMRSVRAAQPNVKLTPGAVKSVAGGNDIDVLEATVEKQSLGEDRQYLLRVYRRRQASKYYIVAAGTTKTRYARLAGELRLGVESFRLLNPIPDDWRK